MDIRKKMILTVVLMSYFVTALNVSIVLTGVNPIMEDLGLSAMELGWVQNGYTLAFGGLILLGGNLSDVYGRRPVMTNALIGAGIGSLLAGLAWDDLSLIAARILQGVSAAILAPTSLALLMDTFSGKELVRVVAWYSSISGLGASAGLVLGGVLADFASWRVGFALTVPVAAGMIWLSLRYIPRKDRIPGQFDLAGTVLSVAGVFMLVYAMNGALSPRLWMVAALTVLSVFFYVERRADHPIMPLSLYANPVRRNAYAARFLFLAAMFGFWFYISLYAQKVMGLTPLFTGLAFLPMTLPQFAASALSPGLIQRMGNKNVLLISAAFNLAGLFGMMGVTETSHFFWNLFLPLVLLGLGQGLALSPLTNYGIYETDEGNRGAASGLVNVSHQIGGSVGLSVMLMVSGTNASPMMGFHNGMIMGFGFILGMTLLALRFPKTVTL